MAVEHRALLLAAGGSTRLGTPKQLLARDGEPLVRRAVRALLSTGPREVRVVVGADAARIEAALAGLDVVPVHNPAWRDGMASSLRAGTQGWTDAGVCVIAGCDQPQFDADDVRALLAMAGNSPVHAAALDHGASRGGIPAVVPMRWLRAGPDAGEADAGLRARLRATAGVGLYHRPALTFDIDTPADLAHAIEHQWVDAPSGPA
jgi:molybdenum cofactor cytidylyltransferase